MEETKRRGREGQKSRRRRGRRRCLWAAYLHLYINPAFGNQRKKPTASGGVACITYFPAAQTLQKWCHPFVLMCIWNCQDSSRIVGSSVWMQTTVWLGMLDFRVWMCSEMLHWSDCLCDASRPTGLTGRETSSNDTLFRADQRNGR